MTLDLSKYKVQLPDESEQIDEHEKMITKSDPIDLSKYLVKEEKPETPYMDMAREGARHLTRIGARVGETIVGMPGDVVNMVEWMVNKLPTPPQILKKDPTFVQQAGQKFLKSLPSSTELKEKTSELTEGFTDPQGTFEEFGDSIVELATALTIGKDPTKIKNILGALGKATVAKTAGKGAELLGAGETGQFATEMGTLFLMGLMSKPLANKFVSDQYQQARTKIPEGATINTKKLTKNLQDLEDQLSKGLSTTTKNEVKSAVSELKAKTLQGKYPVEELVDAYHDINERMTSKKLFDELSSAQRKKLRMRYDSFKDVVRDELRDYGKTNPEFFEQWQGANQAYATIENSKRVSHFLESHLGKLPAKVASGMAIELFLGHPSMAALTGGTFASMKSGELFYRVAKSPVLREHYINVIKAASEENLPAVINSMKKLDQGLKESFIEED